MHATLPSRDAKAIKIHCPVDRGTLDLVAAGRFSSIGNDTALSAILSILRDDNPLGDFGIYKSVIELSAGWELFVPGTAANPTLGDAGVSTASPTVILSVYVPGDARADAISTALHAIMAAHPWEVPVIEVRDVALLVRDSSPFGHAVRGEDSPGEGSVGDV